MTQSRPPTASELEYLSRQQSLFQLLGTVIFWLLALPTLGLVAILLLVVVHTILSPPTGIGSGAPLTACALTCVAPPWVGLLWLIRRWSRQRPAFDGSVIRVRGRYTMRSFGVRKFHRSLSDIGDHHVLLPPRWGWDLEEGQEVTAELYPLSPSRLEQALWAAPNTAFVLSLNERSVGAEHIRDPPVVGVLVAGLIMIPALVLFFAGGGIAWEEQGVHPTVALIRLIQHGPPQTHTGVSGPGVATINAELTIEDVVLFCDGGVVIAVDPSADSAAHLAALQERLEPRLLAIRFLRRSTIIDLASPKTWAAVEVLSDNPAFGPTRSRALDVELPSNPARSTAWLRSRPAERTLLEPLYKAEWDMLETRVGASLREMFSASTGVIVSKMRCPHNPLSQKISGFSTYGVKEMIAEHWTSVTGQYTVQGVVGAAPARCPVAHCAYTLDPEVRYRLLPIISFNGVLLILVGTFLYIARVTWQNIDLLKQGYERLERAQPNASQACRA